MFGAHEIATEKFYGTGVEKFGDYHRRFLNFGLWENNITDYVSASEHLLKRVADSIKLNAQSKLLDVACGMGTQDTFFMSNYDCASIEALDLTTKHIELAKQHNNHPKINFVRGNACHLPYSNETFTHVIGIEGPANFNTREKFLREAYRVLKPGGYVGLSDYSLARNPNSWWERQLIKYATRFWHMPEANIHTNEVFANVLRLCGFAEVNIEVVTKHVIPGYIAENRKPENRKEIYRIRGPMWGPLSDYLDNFVEWLYNRKLVDYVLVSARKPEKENTTAYSGVSPSPYEVVVETTNPPKKHLRTLNDVRPPLVGFILAEPIRCPECQESLVSADTCVVIATDIICKKCELVVIEIREDQ